jgi:hypothetical protein
MQKELIRWYRCISLEPPKIDDLVTREKAILKILDQDEMWLLDCIRLFLGKKTSNAKFATEIRDFFLSLDPLFLEGNDLELKILAGSSIYKYIIDKRSRWVDFALALVSGSFGISFENAAFIDVINTGKRQLAEESISVRSTANVSRDQAHESTSEVNLETESESQLDKMQQAVSLLQKQIDVIKEESDIHWWLFRQYSNLLGKPLESMSPMELPISISSDLAALTRFKPMPLNFDQFISRAVADNANDFSFKKPLGEFVAQLSDSTEELLNLEKNDYGNLRPLTFGAQKLKELSTFEAWAPVFDRDSNIKRGEEFTIAEITSQLYIERILSK